MSQHRRNGKLELHGELAGAVIPAETLDRAIALHDPGHNPTLLPDFVDSAHREWALSFFGPCERFDVHVHKITEKTPTRKGWVRHFPHVHNDDSLTVVTFLTEPEEGGEFAYIENDEIIKVPAKVGTYAICDGRTWHGPMPVKGPKPRYALLTTGFPCHT